MPKIGIDIGYYNPRKIVPISFTDGTNSGGGYTSIMTDYLTRLAAEGGSLTAPEIVALNLLTQNADIGEFDRLWIHGLFNQIAARISLVNALTADLITEVNSPTFTVNQGFNSNGTTSYLDHNIAENALTKYTQNSNSIFVYSLSNISELSNEYGVFDGVSITACILNDGALSYALNNTLIASATFTSNLNSLGLFFSQRVGTSVITYKNGVSLFSNTKTSQPLLPLNMYSLCRNDVGSAAAFSTKRHSVIGYGSGVIDQAQFYTDIQTLGTTLGWAV